MSGTIKEQFEQREREMGEQIQRAVDRGGLPVEVEVDGIDAALQQVFDVLEDVVSRVAGVSKSFDGSDLPAAVTLEDIGVLAVIVETVDRRCDDFRRMSAELAAAVAPLDSIRHEQRARSAA